jgi:hypothetical protein
MDLLEIFNGHVYPSVHALMIEPFKSMWANDRSPDREEVLKDFMYVELLCSPKKSNPYFGCTDLELREKRVKMEVYKNENHPTSTDMLFATMKYRELLENESPSYAVLEEGLVAAEKSRIWCRDLDLGAKTPNGALLLKPRDIMNALNEIPNTVKKLEDARTKVITEIADASKMKKDREPGFFER